MKKAIKLTAILLTLVMVMGVVVSCDIPFIDELGNFNGLSDIINMFTGDNNVLVASSQNFTVYSGAAKCFFMNNFNGFSRTYSIMYVSYFNLDVNSALEDQYVEPGSIASSTLGFSGTWMSYFANETMNDISETLALCEYGLAHGLSAKVNESDVSAAMSSLTSGYGAVSHIGGSMDEDSVRDYLELVTLADSARELLREKIEKNLAPGDIDRYANNNKESYECIDVVKYEFHIYSQDFESEEEFQAQLDKSNEHMWQVCGATTPEEFVRLMDGRSDDVADYLEKGYMRSGFDKETADKLFTGEVGTTAYGTVQSDSGDGTKVTYTAYMRCSDIYMAKTRNYYYAVFSDNKVAGDMITELKALGKYDFSEFREIASRYGATVVELKENQVKSSQSSGIIYEYSYGVSIPNDTEAETDVFFVYDEETETCVDDWETDWETELYDELPLDYYENYYSASKVSDTAVTYKDYYLNADSGNLNYYYDYSVNTDGTNPGYTILVPGDGVTITPGNGGSFVIGNFSTVLGSNTAVDNWVFDPARQVGDIADEPVSVSGGFAVLVYSGEGEECYVVDAKNKLIAERLQEEIDLARAKVSVSFDKNLEDLFATPKKSSGFLGF